MDLEKTLPCLPALEQLAKDLIERSQNNDRRIASATEYRDSGQRDLDALIAHQTETQKLLVSVRALLQDIKEEQKKAKVNA